MENHTNAFEKSRLTYNPVVPNVLKRIVSFSSAEKTTAIEDEKEIGKAFPHTYGREVLKISTKEKDDQRAVKVGVVFSGGQASGGHNVIAGIYDAMIEAHPKSQLLGFSNGPAGIVENRSIQITKELIDRYRNIGGFDLIGSGRTKIETLQQLESSAETVKELNLDGLIVIGGDDSNTNAAVLAEYFLSNDIDTKVIGVPKTIDGDLQNDFIEISFGFDTACKTYSEMIANICRDAFSAKKYYHFIKLMGRSASHIALECALQTQPNIVLIAEEVQKHNLGLMDVTVRIADIIEKRAQNGKSYGVVLIPEGLIEFFPDMKNLIAELNGIIAEKQDDEDFEQLAIEDRLHKVREHLSKEADMTYDSLPKSLQEQLILDRDPHGNVQVSLIQTEQLLATMVGIELKQRNEKGSFVGKFKSLSHFFGYEGRSGYPSNFDANYCYNLGRLALFLVNDGHTGYMSCITNLNERTENWQALGLPITMMMNVETRAGKRKPVIRKSLVDLEGKAYQFLDMNREKWAIEDCYVNPGPIQYEGDRSITDSIPLSVSVKRE